MTDGTASAVLDQTDTSVLLAGSRVQARDPAHRTLPYNPAFDGIRGLAVAAVLLFHHGVGWMRGGYLGVSTFFTLSGFLITSLLLAERARTGRVRLSRFWARRVRRLLPAATVTLLGVVVLALAVDEPWERSLRGDLWAAALQVANWRFLFDDRSYGELFADPSPVLHFWSLAIEEQFYWVFPLLTVGVLALARGRRAVYGAALVTGLALAAGLTFRWGPDASDTVYYSTFTRMAEILAGALLAVLLSKLSSLWGSNPHNELNFVWASVGTLAIAASVFAWATVDRADPGLYRGGLLAYAGVSTALVAAAALSPLLRPLLGWRPLRGLGLISYGVYLFHWPIYLVLDSDRTGLPASGWALGVLRIGATLVVAVASFVLLEQPIRTGRWPVRMPAPALAVSAVATVVAVALVVPQVAEPPPDTFEDAFAEAQARDAARVAALPETVPRALFFGDSAALMIGAGVGSWGLETGRIGVPGEAAEVGCGIGRGGERRQYGAVGSTEARCDWSQTWPDEIARYDPAPTIAVLLTGSWDVLDRRLPGDDRWRSLGDPVYDEFLRGELAAATDLLRAEGLTVIWLTTPELDFGRSTEPRPPADPPDTPERIDRLNQMIREVAAGRPGVAVVDLHRYFAELPPGEDARLRPDGIHVEMGTAGEVAEWLGPRILAAAG